MVSPTVWTADAGCVAWQSLELSLEAIATVCIATSLVYFSRHARQAKWLFGFVLRPPTRAIFAIDRPRFVLVLSTNANLARGLRHVAHHFPPSGAEFTLFVRWVAEHVVGAVGVARQSCCWNEGVARGDFASRGNIEIGGVLPNGTCRALGTGHGYVLERI